MKAADQILQVLPDRYAAQLRDSDFEGLEELRMGTGRPLRMRYSMGEKEIWPISQKNMIADVIQRACRHSVYSYSESIAKGYVTLEGGHRIGICGQGFMQNEEVRTIRDPTSINIRIAREMPGVADQVFKFVQDSTLILGPPGCGKTTLLRDLVRQLSDTGHQYIGLVDERGEISACVDGETQLNIGVRTDVMLHVPKHTAMMMLLRTMSPDWIAVDEITSPSDIDAMEQISYCGVRLLATAHGRDISDLRRRPLYRNLMETELFRKIVIMHKDKSCQWEEIPL